MLKEYVRDRRSPTPASEAVSKLMSSVKGKDTKPELLIRRALFKVGIRGYRIHWKQAPGNPDIAFVSRKMAIFIHGCFWHRCPSCQPHTPKRNVKYWEDKFDKTIERDRRNKLALLNSGWRVVEIWECEIRNDLTSCVKEIRLQVEHSDSN